MLRRRALAFAILSCSACAVGQTTTNDDATCDPNPETAPADPRRRTVWPRAWWA